MTDENTDIGFDENGSDEGFGSPVDFKSRSCSHGFHSRTQNKNLDHGP